MTTKVLDRIMDGAHTPEGKVIAVLLALCLSLMSWNVAALSYAMGSDEAVAGEQEAAEQQEALIDEAPEAAPAPDDAAESAEEPAAVDAVAPDAAADENAQAADAADPDAAAADGKAEADQPDAVAYPAVKLEQRVNGATITVTAPEGALPEGVRLVVRDVTSATVASAVEDALDVSLEQYQAFDITLLDKDGNEIQPNESVSVTFRNADVESAEANDISVYHISDEGEVAEVPTTISEGNLQQVETDTFSIYIVAKQGENSGEETEQYAAARATYTFFDQDGTQLSVQTVKQGDVLTEPITQAPYGEAPAWTIDETNEALVFTDGKYTVGALQEHQAYTVRASYEPLYTVTFYKDSAGTSVSYIKLAREGEQVSIDDVTLGANDVGEAFVGWSTTLSGTTVEEGTAITMGKADVNLYPVFSSGKWITFNAAQAGKGASYLAPLYIPDGSEVTTVGTSSLGGYTFDGWYTEGAADENGPGYTGGTKVFNADGSLANSSYAKLTKDLDVYGHWTAGEVSYKVVYWRQNASDEAGLDDKDKTYAYDRMDNTRTATVGETVKPLPNDTDTTAAGTGFKYNAEKSTTSATVEADGTTVLNVYFDREAYTLTFYVEDYVYTVTTSTATNQTQYGYWDGSYHQLYYKNSAWRQSNNNNGTKYTGTRYTRSTWRSTQAIKTITALVGHQIKDEFPIKGTNGITYNNGEFWKAKDSETYNANLSFIDVMPAENITFNATSLSGSKQATIYYCVEALDSDSVVRTYNNVGYEIYNTLTLKVSNTIVLTEAEDYPDLLGYSKAGSNPAFGSDGELSFKDGASIYLYYNRSGQKVDYIDTLDGSEIDSQTVKYGAQVPDIGAPHVNHPGYTFTGWYKDEACTQKFDFADATEGKMGSTNLVLYAGWEQAWYHFNVDPDYGELQSGESTWFWRSYGQEGFTGYGNVTRDYVKVGEGNGDYRYEIRRNYEDSAEQRYARYVSVGEGNGDYVYSPGYWTLLGWYQVTDSGLVPYRYGTPVTGDTTVKAVWGTTNALSVTYALSSEDAAAIVGDVTLPEDDTAYTGGAVTVAKGGPSAAPEGKVFIGWNIGGATVKAGNTFVVDATYATNDVLTATAVFADAASVEEPNKPKTTSVFYYANFKDSAGNDVYKPIENEVVVNSAFTAKGQGEFQRDGYRQLGWSFSPTGTVQVPFGQSIFADEVNFPQANRLYAVWKPYFSGRVSLDSWYYGETKNVAVAQLVPPAGASVDDADYTDPTIEYSTDGGTTYTSDVPTQVGAYKVRATWAATAKGFEEVQAVADFNILPRNITVTAVDASRAYGTENPTFTYAFTAEGEHSGFMGDDTFEGLAGAITTLATEATKASQPGDYSITFAGAPEEPVTLGNYAVTYAPGTLTVTNNTTPITIASGTHAPWVYDAQDHTYHQYTVTYGEGADATVIVGEADQTEFTLPTGDTITITPTGTVKNVADTADNNNTFTYKLTNVANYAEPTVTYGNLVVTKALVTVTAHNESKFYGDDDPELTATVVGLMSEDDSVAYELTRADGETVEGSPYAITFVNPVTDQGNYEVIYYDGQLAIIAANGLTVNLDAYASGFTRVYNGEKLTFGEPEVTITHKVNGETVTESYSGATITYYTRATADDEWQLASGKPGITEAGQLQVRVVASAENYQDAVAELTLTVLPKPVTVTAFDANKVFGANDPDAFTFTRTGMLESEEANAETLVPAHVSRAAGEDASTYAITFTESNGVFGNYDITYVPAVFTIAKLPVTVTITGHNHTDIYSGSAFSVSGYETKIGNPLYTDGDFTFSGTAEAARTNVVEDEDVDGQTNMGLAEEQFTNTNDNFNVMFVVAADGYQKVEPLAVTVSIKGAQNTAEYDGGQHSVSGYDVTEINNALYTKDDFVLNEGANTVASRTNAGTQQMNLTGASFQNKNSNFNVIFNVEDGFQAISKISATVTIKGKQNTVDYDGKKHEVDSYKATFSTSLYTDTSFKFNGTAHAERKDVGTTKMGLNASQFQNVDPNFENVKFVIAEGDDGYLEITPISAVVTITAHNNGEGATYSGEAHTVSGYDVSIDNALYTKDDFRFTGTDSISRTAAGQDTFTFTATDFVNTNANFENVTFNIVPGYVKVNPLDVEVTIVGKNNGATGEPYDGKEHVVEGYGITEVSNKLYDANANVALIEGVTAKAATTDAATVSMGLAPENFQNKSDNFDVTFKVTDGYVKVNPIDVTVTVTAPNNADSHYTYNGEAQSLSGLSATADPALYSVSNVRYDGKTLDNVSVSGTGAGEYPFTLDASKLTSVADSNFNVTFSDPVNGTMYIDPLPITVTAKSAEKTYGNNDPEPFVADVKGANDAGTELAQAFNAYAVTRTNAAVNNADTYENVLVPAPTGGYVAVDGQDNTYDQGNFRVTYVPGNFTIKPAEAGQLNLTAKGYEGVYDGKWHEVEASATVTEGTTISYQVLNANTDEWVEWPAGAENAVPRIKDVGEYKVKVIAKNSNYVEAEQIVTLKVTRKQITVKAQDAEKKFGEPEPDFTVEITDSENGQILGTGTVDASNWGSFTLGSDTVKYVVTRGTGDVVGTYDIIPTGGAVQDNYSVKFEKGTLTITPAELNLVAQGWKGEYDAKPHALPEPSVNYGAVVYYSVYDAESDTWSEKTTATPEPRTNAGTTKVRVSATLDNYKTEKDYEEVELTVEPKAVTVTADAASKPYDNDSSKPEEYTATVSGLLGNDTIAYSVTRIAGENVGEYTITAAPSGDFSKVEGENNVFDQGNYRVTYKTGIFTVSSASVTVTANPAEKTYGEEDPNLTATVVGLHEGDKIEYTVARDSGENAGTYGITPFGEEYQGNYQIQYVTSTAGFTIKPKAVTVTAVNKTKTYSGDATTDPALTATVEGLVSEKDTVLYTLSREGDQEVGTYAIGFAEENGIQGNYDVSYVPGTFTITPATMTVTAGNYDAVYDGGAHAGSGKASVEAGTSYEYKWGDGDWQQTPPSVTNVADGPITYTVKATNPNYKDATDTGTLNVLQKEVTIAAQDTGKVYGTNDPESLPVVITGLVVDTDTVEYSATRVAGENVGNYNITVNADSDQGNYKVTPKNAVFTITPASTMTIQGTSLGKEYDATPLVANYDLIIPDNNTTGTTIEYSTNYDADNPSAATWTTKAPSITNVGDLHYWVRATNDNYDQAISDEIVLTVTAAPLTINVKPQIDYTYDGTAKGENNKTYTDAAEISDKVEVTGLQGDDTLTSITLNGMETDANTYTSAIAAFGANVTRVVDGKTVDVTSNYSSITYNAGTLTIAKAKTLTLDVEGYDKPYDGAWHSMVANPSVTDGTTLTYTVNTGDGGPDKTYTEFLANPASRNTPTIRDVGEWTVTVKATNPNYEDAVRENVILKVSPYKVTVTAQDNGKVYGDPEPVLSATVSETLDGDTVAYTLVRESGEDAGTYVISFRDPETTQSNYEVKFVPATFTISKADSMTVVANGYKGAYDAQEHRASATPSVSVGTTITYSVDYDAGNPDAATWTEEAPSITSVGSQNFWVKATNRNYDDAIDGGTLEVTRKAATIIANNTGKMYDNNTTIPAGYTARVEGVIDGFQPDYTVSRESGEDVGTYTITPTGDVNQGNYAFEYKTGTFTITASDEMSITSNSGSKEYDGKALTAESSLVIPNGDVEGTTINYRVRDAVTGAWGDWSTDVPSITGVGVVTYQVQAVNNDYATAEPVDNEFTLTVTPKAATVTAQPASKVFGAADPTAFEAVVGGLVEGESENLISYTVSRPRVDVDEDATTYTNAIVPTGAEAQGNYTVTFVPADFTITPAASSGLGLNVTGYEGVYDADAHYASATSIVQDARIEYSTDGGETWSGIAPSVKDVDNVTVDVRATHQNYQDATASASLIVTPAPVTVKVDPASQGKVYGTAEPALTTIVEGLVGGEPASRISYTTSRAAGENVGGYAITPSGQDYQGNYHVTYVPGSFTISKATMAVSATGHTGVYDAVEHAVTAVPSVADDTTIAYSTDGGRTWSADAPSIINVGEQAVIVRATNPNYYDVTDETALKVTPKTVSVAAVAKSKTYDNSTATDPELTATVDGTLNGDAISYGIARELGQEAGEYAISVEPQGSFTEVEGQENTYDQGNYRVTYTPGTFTIVPVGTEALNLQAVSYAGDYDGTTHVAGYTHSAQTGVTTITYSTNYSAANPNAATWTSTAPSIKDAGTTNFWVRAENPNYQTAIAAGSLVVNRLPVTVTAADQTKVYGTDDPTLTDEVEGVLRGESDALIARTLNRVAGEDVAGSPYDINVVADAVQGNYDVSVVGGKLTITKAPADQLGLTADGYQGIYDGQAHRTTASATVTDRTAIQYSTNEGQTWSNAAPAITNVGERTVQVKATNPNYEDATATVALEVTPAEVSVVVDPDQTKVFGEADPVLTATVSDTVNNEPASLIQYGIGRAEGQDVGEYAIAVSGAAEQGNYRVSYTPGTFTITKAAADGLALVAAGGDWVYDAAPHAVVASSAVAGTAISYSTDDGETWTTTAPAVTHVADGPVTVQVKAENDNYETATAEVTLNIQPKAATVKALNNTKVYSGNPGNDPQLEAAVQGVIDDYEIQYTVSRAAGEEVEGSPYAITAEPAGDFTPVAGQENVYDQGDYRVTYEPGDFTITPEDALELGLTAIGAERVFDNQPLLAGANVVIEGTAIEYSTDYDAENPDDATWSAEAPSITNVGSQEFWVRATNDNYATAIASATLVVTPKAATVTVDAGQGKAYGAADPTLTASVAGIVDGDAYQLPYELTRAEGEDVANGPYAITAAPSGDYAAVEGLDNTYDQGNYRVTYTGGAFVIENADMTLSAQGYEGLYDGRAHGLMLAPSQVGVQYAYSTDEGATWTASTPSIRDAGEQAYQIRATKANYNPAYASATLTVEPRTVTLTSADATKTYDGTALTSSEVAVGGEGWATGEGATYVFTGTQTYVGASENEFTYALSQNAKADNYIITQAYGTLAVTDEGVDPADLVSKTHEENAVYDLGDTVSFEIAATNIYDRPMNVTFEELPGVTLAQDAFNGVAAGETVSTTASYVITAADVAAGSFANTVTAVFTDPATGEQVVTPAATDAVDEIAGQQYALSVTKETTSNQDVYNVGDTVTYQIAVTNTGNQEQTGVVVTDELQDAAGAIEFTSMPEGATADGNQVTLGTLAPGETATIEAAYTVERADAGASIANTAIAANNGVSGSPSDSATTSNSATVESPYTLTFNYVYADGSQAAPSTTAAYLAGEEWTESFPTIDGFTSAVNGVAASSLAGTMQASDADYTVVYTAIPAAAIAVIPAAAAGPVAPVAAAVPAAAAAVAPAPAVVTIDDDGNPLVESIEDDENALASGLEGDDLAGSDQGGWALVNVLASVLAVVLAAVMLIAAFGRKQDEDEDDGEAASKRHRTLRIASIIPAAAAIVALLLTQDFSQAMVMVDAWTVLFVILAAANVALMVLTQQSAGDADDDSTPTPAMA